MGSSKESTEGLTLLGQGATRPQTYLEAFPNRYPGHPYLVVLHTNEFTAVCPVTGQPDFASITIKYIPDEKVVESKSLKLYLWSFRDRGIFHEHVVNEILDELWRVCEPRWAQVIGRFNVRGGISITVTTEKGDHELARRLLETSGQS